MNEKIDEILDFKEDADYKRLSVDEITILRDYITNLQEELEAYKKERKNILDKSKRLNYKSRIDKTIEFIEEHNIIGTNKEYLPSGIEKCYSLELMEILKGSDKVV